MELYICVIMFFLAYQLVELFAKLLTLSVDEASMTYHEDRKEYLIYVLAFVFRVILIVWAVIVLS